MYASVPNDLMYSRKSQELVANGGSLTVHAVHDCSAAPASEVVQVHVPLVLAVRVHAPLIGPYSYTDV